MNDLISREAAIELIGSLEIMLGGKLIFHPEAKKSVIDNLDMLPAVDAEPVRRGRWEKSKATFHRKCSCCGSNLHMPRERKYCPNCGAKMEETK